MVVYQQKKKAKQIKKDGHVLCVSINDNLGGDKKSEKDLSINSRLGR